MCPGHMELTVPSAESAQVEKLGPVSLAGEVWLPPVSLLHEYFP